MQTPRSLTFHAPILLAAIIGGSCLVACSSNTGRSARGQRSGNELVVGLAEAGGVLELGVGQMLLVELPEAPSSGRVWQMVRRPDPAVLMPDGNRYEQTEAEKAAGDLVGLQQLRFKAVGPGEAILSLALVRPGTGLASSDERWMGQIVVR
jgi:predicted secreted protein